MTRRLLALPVCLAIATSLVAAPGFAQAPATPAPAGSAAPAAAPAPAPAAAPAAPMKPAHTASVSGAKPSPAVHTQRVQSLQTALNANGAQVTVDGKMGPKTHSALMDFQKAHGLKVTGKPDKETRDALKVSG